MSQFASVMNTLVKQESLFHLIIGQKDLIIVQESALTHTSIHVPSKRIIAYTPFTNDRIAIQKIKHFKGTEEEFQEKWK